MNRLPLIGLFILAVALPAMSLPQGNIVLCASEDGRRHSCPADTRGGVQMTRQHSSSPCVQGSTWGFDRQGIWVDRGCRAEFTIGTYNDRPISGPMGGIMGGQGMGGQVIACSSDDGRRHICPADTRGGVQMTRQHSESPCRQGSTWGFDRQGIWVDRGCRAEFTLTNYSYHDFRNHWGRGGEISCSSDDERRHYCETGPVRSVRLQQQVSGSPCIEGRTWGRDRNGIWVDRGCRAVFRVR